MKNYVIRFGSGDPRTSSGLSPTMLIFVRSDTGATLAPPSVTEIAATWGLYTFQWGTTTPIAFLCDGATSNLGQLRYVTGSLDPADRADEYGNTMVALGNTIVFNAPANMGSTLVAIGNTAIALGNTIVFNAPANMGATLVAIGNTVIAIGTSHLAQGTTMIALGTTAVSWGSAIGSTLVATGSTLVAIGNTSIALGTNAVSSGITSVALGNSILSIVGGFTSTLSGIGSTASSFGTTTADPVDLFGYMKRVIENLEGDQDYFKQTGVLQIYSRGSSTLLRQKTIANSISTVIKS